MTTKREKKTSISELGEFGLINELTKELKLRNESSKTGVGDDAAVVNYGSKDVLLSTDLLLEGIHFNLVYTPLKHLGYKAAVVNFSDIYAMNGRPKQMTVSIGLSSRFLYEDVEELYEGIKLACDAYGVDLVGGDTSSSMTGLVISISVTGEAVSDKPVLRSTAKENDLICVSGDLGAAFMGLQVLERERKLFEGKGAAQPKLEGYEYQIGKQLKPEAREDIIDLLEKEGIHPTSMMDISDGLASELLHISKSSNCGCHVYTNKIPIEDSTAEVAEEMNLAHLTAAMNGGEDYELLFTVPLADHDKVASMKDISIIGHIVNKEKGKLLVTPEGQTIEIQAQGWEGK